MGFEDRERRFLYASEKMGSTVVAGAMTTLGSASIMFFCQLVAFTKMAYVDLRNNMLDWIGCMHDHARLH